jgi:hypothetical protein
MTRLLPIAAAAALLLLALLRPSHAEVVRYYGMYRGEVVSNADPLQQGRLDVQVPAVLGTRAEWAAPSVPFGDGTVSSIKLPPVGSAVWVEFEGGNPSYPVWVGWTPLAALPRLEAP